MKRHRVQGGCITETTYHVILDNPLEALVCGTFWRVVTYSKSMIIQNSGVLQTQTSRSVLRLDHQASIVHQDQEFGLRSC